MRGVPEDVFEEIGNRRGGERGLMVAALFRRQVTCLDKGLQVGDCLTPVLKAEIAIAGDEVELAVHLALAARRKPCPAKIQDFFLTIANHRQD